MIQKIFISIFLENKFTFVIKKKAATRLKQHILLGHHMPQTFVYLETSLQIGPLVITNYIDGLRKKLKNFARLILNWIFFMPRKSN